MCHNTNFPFSYNFCLTPFPPFTATKAYTVKANNIFYLHIGSHTILPHTHSFILLLLPKLLKLSLRTPALLKSNTTSAQQAGTKVWYFNRVLNNSVLPLNSSTPDAIN